MWNFTSFPFCDNSPVYHPWLNSTKKLKEEDPIWKVFVLPNEENMMIYRAKWWMETA